MPILVLMSDTDKNLVLVSLLGELYFLSLRYVGKTEINWRAHVSS